MITISKKETFRLVEKILKLIADKFQYDCVGISHFSTIKLNIIFMEKQNQFQIQFDALGAMNIK
jgi:hypothetical protein